MAVRIATFNAENLMHRFDFSGFKNETLRDRAIQVLEVKDEDIEKFRNTTNLWVTQDWENVQTDWWFTYSKIKVFKLCAMEN